MFAGVEPSRPSEIAPALDAIGVTEELARFRGTFTHHYPIAVRRVLPDDGLIAMSSGPEGPYYALSFITYVEPRGDFLVLASFLARSLARIKIAG